MQDKVWGILQELFPKEAVRKRAQLILIECKEITLNDLDKMSKVEGMYKDLVIKRSVTGIVIVLMF